MAGLSGIREMNDQLKRANGSWRFTPQDARVPGGERAQSGGRWVIVPEMGYAQSFDFNADGSVRRHVGTATAQMQRRCPAGAERRADGKCWKYVSTGSVPNMNLIGYQGPGVGSLDDVTKLDKAQAVAVNQLVSSLASHNFVADPRSTVIFPKDLSLGYDTAQILIDPMDDGGVYGDPAYIANFAHQLALSAAALDFTLADLGVDGNGVPINTGFQWNIPDVFGGVNPAPCGPRQLRKTDGSCADCTPNAHANDAGNGCACDAGYDLQADGTCLLRKDAPAPAPTAAKPSKWPWVAAFVAIGGAVVLAVAKEKRA